MEVVRGRRAPDCQNQDGARATSNSLAKPMGFGLAAAALLLGFYVATITLAQDWAHARAQLESDLWFVAAVTGGFGLQVGMFTYLRSLHAHSRSGAMAASTGTSTVAMLACCAHHVADALPLLGLSGAAVFLNDYKEPVLWAGITMNALGISYLAWKIRQERTRMRPAAGSASTACAVER